MQPTIAVLLDETISEREYPRFRVAHLARRWEKMGFAVRVTRSLGELRDADLVVPQIDRSVLPRKVRKVLAEHPRVVNRRVSEIRRTSFSENLVSGEDAYEGPVLVKTNANCGGIPERKAARRLPLPRRVAFGAGAFLRAARRTVRARSLSPLARTELLMPRRYPVYPKPAAVPPEVFRNPSLVVEKFLPERDGADYVLRSYAFFGPDGFAVRSKGPHRIVKGASGHAPEFVEPHPDVVAVRERLGFDYGKFDYTVHDGEAVVFDVNWTPTFGRVFPEDMRESMADRLARGIRAWFPEACGTLAPGR